MNDVVIYQHLGLGDHIICNALVRHFGRSVNSSKEMRYGKCVNFIWNSKHVYKYEYKPTYPHAGTGSGKMVNLDKYIKY